MASIAIISSAPGRELDRTGPACRAVKAALIHYAQGLADKLARRK
jgi:NAD(P)-dependent dehydrogenase (short-subunit alcohol dehydrogenase family)